MPVNVDVFLNLAGNGSAISNLNASNLTFGVVDSSLIYGNTLSNIQSSNITQPFSNLAVSNSVTTANITATRGMGVGTYAGSAAPTNSLIVSGNTGIGTSAPGYLLDVAGYMRSVAIVDHTSSIGSAGQVLTSTGSTLEWAPGFTQPLANLVVSNSVTTTNIYASNSVTTTNIISPGITSVYGPVTVNGVPVITAVNTITGLTSMDRVNCYEPYFVNASASSAFSLYKRVVYTNFSDPNAFMPTGCLNPTTGKYYTLDSFGYLYTTDENGFLIESSTQWFTPTQEPSTTLRYYNGLLFACDPGNQRVLYINAPDSLTVTSGALSGASFQFPCDLFIDKSGKIFVADSGASEVWIFQSYSDPYPTSVSIIFPPGMAIGPYCICGDSLGYLYVTLSSLDVSGVVCATKFDPGNNGNILATYASPNPGQYTNFIYGIAVDNFFNVYIGDSPGSATFGQIHKFLNDGTHVAFITLDTVDLYTIIYEPSSDKLIYFWASGFDILFAESQIYGSGDTSYIGITGTSLDLSGSDASRPTLMVTGNVYASNSVTTTNVIATRFYGDGGFLSNIASSSRIYGNTLSNISGSNVTTGINASNVTTGILSSSRIYGNTLSNISGSNVTTGINASNVTTGILSSSLIYGNTLSNISGSNVTTGINASNITTGILSSSLIFGNTLSNIQSSNITQPFANLAVSNSVTTTNIISPGITSVYGPVTVNGVPLITAVNTITGLTSMDSVNCYEPYFVNASASSAFSLYKRVVYTNFSDPNAYMPTGCLNPTTGRYYTLDSFGYLYITDENGFLIGPSTTPWFAPANGPSTTLRYYNGLLFACDSGNQRVLYINAPDSLTVTSGALAPVFTNPADLFIDKSGKIFVADSGASEVWIFQSYSDTSPKSVSINYPPGMIYGPFCICGDSLGYLYVTLEGSDGIPPVAIKIDQTGTILATYTSPNPNNDTNFVYGIAVDNFFNVYIGDSIGSATFGQIHKFLNDGTHVAFITLDTVNLWTIIYEPSSDKLIYFWASGFDILFAESQIYGSGNMSYIGITGTSLDLSGSDASRPTLKVTGNVYASNSLTTSEIICNAFTTSTATKWNYISNALPARSTSVGWEGIRQVFGDYITRTVYVYNNAVLETTLSYPVDGFGAFVAVGGRNDAIIVVSGVDSFYVYNFNGLIWSWQNFVDTYPDIETNNTLWMPSLSAGDDTSVTLVIGGYGYDSAPFGVGGNQVVGVYNISLSDGSTSFAGVITPSNSVESIYRNTVAISGDGTTIAIGQQDSSILYVYSITDLSTPVFSDTTDSGDEYYVSIDYYGQIVLLTLNGSVRMYSNSLTPV